MLFLLLGLSWATFQFGQQLTKQLPIEYEGQTINITGVLQGLPQNGDQSSKFYYKVASAYSQTANVIPELTNQVVLISCYRCNLNFAPKQHWQLSVRLKRPHSYASWGAFDYEKYLFRHQVIATGYIREKEANKLLTKTKDKFIWSIDHWRWKLSEHLNERLSSNEIGKAMIAALMIGDKSQFSTQQKIVFQKTGISHLMAISGLHIGLAFLVTSWLLKWCFAPIAQIYHWVPRQKLVLIPSLLIAFFYAALAGFAISTERAMIMLALYVLAKFVARDVSLLKVLMVTVLIILLIDPFSILDVGFWLSCSAVLVIALLSEYHLRDKSEPIDDEGRNKLSLIKLQPILWVSMLPVTLLFFGKISILSPFINLLLVPLFCGLLIPITLLGLIMNLLGLIVISDWVLQFLSHCYEWIYLGLEWVSQFQFASIPLPPMRLVDWIVFVLLSFSYYAGWRFKHVVATMFVCLMLFNNPRNLSVGEYNVALLDVGQGLAMVVEAYNYVLVYDTGPSYSSGFSTAQAVLIPYLQQRGIRHIDTLIISHADNDHIGGYPDLQGAFRISQILTSRVDKIPHAKQCRSGQIWKVSGIDFKIVSPDTNTPQGSNNHSCVLSVSNGAVNTLISGDIEKQVERYMLAKQVELKADIMLVPHQGSKTSSTSEFIDTVDPDLALIAAGYRNHYGHPHGDVISRYLERDVKLVSTIESGSIVLNIKGNIWNMELYRQSNKGFWHHLKKPT